MNRTIKITEEIKVGDGQKLLLLAGPCQIESLEHCSMIAERLLEATAKLPINLVFKSSFDKANRTSINSVRGPGIEEGLEILAKLKEQTGVPLVTDIHLPEQAALAAEVVDILQIPAFLCRQTDLLIAAAKTGKTINLKKGQFLPPEDMKHSLDKIKSSGNDNVMLCERGTCHGYRDLIVDMRSFVIMKSTGFPVVFDATHSVQSMGGAGGASGGSREYISPLTKAACAVGIDGLFIECHEEPARAPSDGASMLPLNELPSLLEAVCKIREAIQ